SLVECWRAVEALTMPVERTAPIAPLIGRESEIDVLRAAWTRASGERRPQLVTVFAPPGMGKSRLAREFGTIIERDGGRTLSGRSFAYGESIGYGPFAQQVRQAAGIEAMATRPEAES